MAFVPPIEQPQFADLMGILAQTRDTDEATYQTIQRLIERLSKYREYINSNLDAINALIADQGGIGPPGPQGPQGPSGDTVPHHITHETGGSDQIVSLPASVITSGIIDPIRLPPNVPTVHHVTHETGGSDAITSLSGSVITSGTVVDARLSSNIPRLDVVNVFTRNNEFQGEVKTRDIKLQNPAFVEFTMLCDAGTADARRWRMTLDTSGMINFQPMSDAQAVLGTVIKLERTGDVKIGRDIYEKGRTVPVGHWTNYTVTWATHLSPPTLGNGSITGKYTVIGRTVLFEIFLYVGSTTSIGNDGIWGFSLPIPSVSQIGGSIFIYNAINGQTFAGTLFWGNQIVGGLIAGMVGAIVNGGSLYSYAPFLSRTIPFDWNTVAGTQCIIIGSYSI